MTQRIHFYVFKPSRRLPAGRAGNRAAMTTVGIPAAEYESLLKLCDADYVVRQLAREASLELVAPAPGKSWTETVLEATRIAALKYDAEVRAWSDANNAAHL